MSSFCVTASTRKARRKEERERKKQNKRAHKQAQQEQQNKTKKSKKTTASATSSAATGSADKPDDKKKRKAVPLEQRAVGKKARRTPTYHSHQEPYANLPPEVAAAMRRDDDEIADLEKKLGLTSGGGSKSRLNQEYAKKECFGEDFGSFLDGLDAMVHRVMAPNSNSNNHDSDDSSDSNSSSDDDDSDIEKEPLSDDGNTSDSDNVEKETTE
ncbi:nucleolar protein with MIF4G domain 1 [Seminavis robusta]|uniref:Nucleolar protein with MIF4G domain 1 n=1 Tax=Seminavis robusta TaxID=568900 RepID=A0A9N8EK41_9STRA|nr:nucleolar protein with MIF4G domain 1 [Seminavis robusta]|eukprot:Sro1277_g258650.1 nucleolar protein with MIF4G domain 1 (213) ;mRNA; f:7924-8562